MSKTLSDDALNEKVLTVNGYLARVKDAVRTASTNEAKAKRRISELEGQLNTAVFMVATGESVEHSPSSLRQAMVDQQIVIEDVGIVFSLAEGKIVQIENELRTQREIQRARNAYNDWKKDVTGNPDLLLNAQSRAMGITCERGYGSRAYYDEFMASMQKGAA